MCSHTWKRSWHHLFSLSFKRNAFICPWLMTNKVNITTGNQTSEWSSNREKSKVYCHWEGLMGTSTSFKKQVIALKQQDHLRYSQTPKESWVGRVTLLRSADQSAVAVLTPTGSCWSSAGQWCPEPRSAHWSSSSTPDPPVRQTRIKTHILTPATYSTPITPTSHSQEERLRPLLQNIKIFL